MVITMSTSDIYKNVPAMNKNAHDDNDSIPPIRRPTKTPSRHSTPETKLNTRARLSETPAFLNTAKSPISCGSS